MKIGIIIYSNDPETVWNAFRYANFALKEGDKVKVFLTGKGVESESLDTPSFKVSEQIRSLIDGGGRIFACGTCLKIRQSEASEACIFSTMKDMYEIIKESDKIVTF
ncbi:MAG: DsrE family protein [Candidatus Hydrothermarchaeales archaeon]